MVKQIFNRIALAVFLPFLFAVTVSAQSDAVKSMRNKASSLQKEIAAKEKILLSSQNDVKSKLDNLSIITARIEERKAYIKLLTQEYNIIEREIRVLNDEIAVQEKEIGESRSEYAEALRRARKYSNFKNRLVFIFSADDFNTMLRRYRYANEYMYAHLVLADSLEAQLNRLEAKRVTLEQTRQAKAASLEEQEAEKKKLESLEKEQRQIVKELQKESDKVKKELQKKRTELKKLNEKIDREIERILAEERAEKRRREEAAKKAAKEAGGKTTSTSVKGSSKKGKVSSSKSTGNTAVTKMSGSFVNNKKKMPVPITGPYLVVDKYGVKNAVEGKGNVPINTGGVTFEGSQGAQARCIFDGKVTAVYESAGYSFVLVRHDEYISVYCNLGNIRVKNGDSIKTGAIIGDVMPDVKGGNPRMLFQLRKEKKTLNPAEWLKM